MGQRSMIDLYRGEDVVLHVGERGSFSFDAKSLETGNPSDYRLRLFIKGEPSVDASVLSEWGGGLFLRDIDDSLSTITHHSRYSLRFQATDEPAERRAYYKLKCDPLTYPAGLKITRLPEDGIWQFSFYTKGVNFRPLGEAEIRAEIYYKKEGRNPNDILDTADDVLRFPLQAGTYDFTKTEGKIHIDDHVACILFTISVGASDGELFVENPALRGATDLSVLPQFIPSSGYATALNWFGENLSHHEWSDFELSVNGRPLGKHSLFSSIFRYAENEFPVDSSAFDQGENRVELRYVSDYFNPAPYKISQISLIAEKKHPFHMVACPHTAVLGEEFAIAVETEEDGLSITAESDNAGICPVAATLKTGKAGLYAVKLFAGEMASDVTITLRANGHTETCTLTRTVHRGKDGVLCGTGDDVYVPQTEDAKREYLKWYLSNEVGSFVTFRPVYHWSGTRSLKPEVWNQIVPFLNDVGLHYCVLFDERELIGLNANPTRDLLEGPLFMGYQGHERDGAYYYWGNGMWGYNGSFYWELRDRILRHPDVSYRLPPKYNGNNVYPYRDPAAITNVREAMGQLERNLTHCLRGFKRHTGVTLLFRHFLHAGVEVVGAETMYANHEILLSGLRGTAYAYSKPETGAHLALQWHVEPVGQKGFHDRYALSLILSYLHGVSHINTEEGLWHMEHGFESHDRFSKACQGNIEVNRKFLRFVNSHTREGAPVHRHAVLYGNGEGAVSYFCTNVWDRDASGWERGAPEDAWNQMKVFYPDSTSKKIQRVQTEKEPGWFSRTPYGLCDILPVEAPADKLAAYPYLAFMGYHLATAELTAALLNYVQNGGTLLLCLCHLSIDDERPRIKEAKFGTRLIQGYEAVTGFSVQEIAYDGYRRAKADWSGVSVKKINAQGEPLVVENQVGKGKVILLNTYEYPDHEAIRAAYAEELRALAEASKEEELLHGEIDTLGNPVQYAVYDLPSGARRIYLTNTAWDAEAPETEAILCLGGKRYRLPVMRNEIGIVNINGELATYTCDGTTEVLEIAAGAEQICVHLQGEGDVKLRLLGREVSGANCECRATDGSTEISLSLCGEKYLEFSK